MAGAASAPAVPADAEQIRLDDGVPVLLGSQCPKCGNSFFPRRWECPIDFIPVDDVDLSRQGTLYVSTHVRLPAYGRVRRDTEGYGVGQIDLPEGVRIQSVLLGEPDRWLPGTPFQIAGESIGEDEEGNHRIIFRFEPVRDREVGGRNG
jgi:uncharacterized protein